MTAAWSMGCKSCSLSSTACQHGQSGDCGQDGSGFPIEASAAGHEDSAFPSLHEDPGQSRIWAADKGHAGACRPSQLLQRRQLPLCALDCCFPGGSPGPPVEPAAGSRSAVAVLVAGRKLI